MTQKGEARRAVALAHSVSFFGGVFSILCLMLLAPFLAKIAPHFGPRKIFLATLLGMILVALAHRCQIFAAGMLASFGIFPQTVRLEPITYSRQFTFGEMRLTSGVDLIVVVLGLFALS